MAALAQNELASTLSNPVRVEMTATAMPSPSVDTFMRHIHGNTQASGEQLPMKLASASHHSSSAELCSCLLTCGRTLVLRCR